MVKTMLIAVVLTFTLSGCEHTHSWAQHFAFMHTTQDSAEQFDFNWRLSGAREVAPLQIFSANDQLWLQFGVEQNIPAIFAIENGRQVPLSYKRSAPYIVIKGNWQQLIFRGAALQAKAQYHPPVLASSLQNPIPELALESGLEPKSESEPVSSLPPSTHPLAQSTPDSKNQIEIPAAAVMVAEPAKSFALNLEQMKYSVAPTDGTMRQALKRWAQREGWVFNDQHWEVEVDLPIVSAALFSADFNDAVTQLMRSTALGARPLQACLYSNKVMRVIPLAQHCDPTVSDSYLPQG